MTYIQALNKLIAHLEERVNMIVLDITLGWDNPKGGKWKFFVEFDDVDNDLEILYIKDVA
jgi:hypothetical protein